MNYYEILGVDRSATPEQIRSAFRLRSHMFHPDKYENYPEPLRGQLKAEAEKEFKRLTLAYDVLRDPQMRQQHDRQLDGGSTHSRPIPSRNSRQSRATGTVRARPRPEKAAPKARASGMPNGRVDSASQPPMMQAPPPRTRTEPGWGGGSAGWRGRDPMLVVNPKRLDFGVLQPGATKQLALRVSNAGGRTLFGEITTNRSWITVSRSSFVSSSMFIFVSADARNLAPGDEFSGTVIVSTLNGGDQVVPVTVRIGGESKPSAMVTPPVLEFGRASWGQFKTRSLRVVNQGAGTLLGSVATTVGWLSVGETRFRGNDTRLEVIAQTTGLAPGTHTSEVQIYTNAGRIAVQARIEIVVPPDEDGRPGILAAGNGEVARLSPAQIRQLLDCVSRIQPQSVWEGEFLRGLERLLRSGQPLAPGELQKLEELERRDLTSGNA